MANQPQTPQMKQNVKLVLVLLWTIIGLIYNLLQPNSCYGTAFLVVGILLAFIVLSNLTKTENRESNNANDFNQIN
ncbi:hypothetical protein [Flavobacterium sp.]|uniref:hypothetical protein n=1 Tax=Flavobacterium sp. TaxID=239 RepID=UPI003B9A6D42